VAIFGDAALTNGISFEALNNIARHKRFIGILNDNEWGIAKNVGRSPPTSTSSSRIPRTTGSARTGALHPPAPAGDVALKLAHKAEEGFKGALNEVTLQPANSP